MGPVLHSKPEKRGLILKVVGGFVPASSVWKEKKAFSADVAFIVA